MHPTDPRFTRHAIAYAIEKIRDHLAHTPHATTTDLLDHFHALAEHNAPVITTRGTCRHCHLPVYQDPDNGVIYHQPTDTTPPMRSCRTANRNHGNDDPSIDATQIAALDPSSITKETRS